MESLHTIYVLGFSEPTSLEILRTSIDRSVAVFCSSSIEKMITRMPGNLLDNKTIHPITPVDTAINYMGTLLDTGNVLVIASGDPLFFGIGKRLIETYGRKRVQVFPSLSFMQVLCSRYGISWDDMHWLSFHGRPITELKSALESQTKLCFFTDNTNTPHLIGQRIKQLVPPKQLESIKVYLGCRLGKEDEQLFEGSIDELVQHKAFPSPNIMIMLQPHATRQPASFGLTEQEVRHSRGLITKDEIRAITLHKLKLTDGDVVWDVGGGSGSVSIEAARIMKNSNFYCIEKKSEEQENISFNIANNRLNNVILINGEAPEILATLPDPDRVFIGGSGGRLAEILAVVCNRIKDGGRIVVNCILASSKQIALETLYEHNFSSQYSEICYLRYDYTQKAETTFNPVTIIYGDKPSG